MQRVVQQQPVQQTSAKCPIGGRRLVGPSRLALQFTVMVFVAV